MMNAIGGLNEILSDYLPNKPLFKVGDQVLLTETWENDFKGLNDIVNLSALSHFTRSICYRVENVIYNYYEEEWEYIITDTGHVWKGISFKERYLMLYPTKQKFDDET